MLSNEIFEEALFSDNKYSSGLGVGVDNKVRQGINNIPRAIGNGVVAGFRGLYNTIDKGVDWVWDKAKNMWGSGTAAQQMQPGINVANGMPRTNTGTYTQTYTPAPNYQTTQQTPTQAAPAQYQQ